jgi:hypothetical protein
MPSVSRTVVVTLVALAALVGVLLPGAMTMGFKVMALVAFKNGRKVYKRDQWVSSVVTTVSVMMSSLFDKAQYPMLLDEERLDKGYIRYFCSPMRNQDGYIWTVVPGFGSKKLIFGFGPDAGDTKVKIVDQEIVMSQGAALRLEVADGVIVRIDARGTEWQSRFFFVEYED